MSEIISINVPKKKLDAMVLGGYFILNKDGSYRTTRKFSKYLKDWVDSYDRI